MTTQSALFAGLLVTAVAAANAGQLYSNGPVVDGSGLSIVPATVGTISLGAQAFYDNRVADDFSVAAGGWTITDIELFPTYDFMTVFGFTTANWSIVAGTDINAGSVVASGTSALTSGGLQGFRVVSPNLTSQQFPIWGAKADIPDLTLAAGTYWLTWSINGPSPAYNGPYQSTTSDFRVGNLKQFYPGSGGWITPHDFQTGLTYELPFVLNGNVAAVPEPASGPMLAGGLALLAVRALRKRRQPL